MLVPVLMYHDIETDDFDVSMLPPERRPYVQRLTDFTAQISYLRRKDFSTLTTSDLAKTRQIPEKSIILTFDDGDASNFEKAFNVLRSNNMKALFFITTGFVGKPGYVSWDHLREMHQAGMEIGSHTVSHSMPTELSDESLKYELFESKKVLEDGLSTRIISFSSPTGYYNPKTKPFAREAGYLFVFVSKIGYLNSNYLDPFCIKRIAIKRNTRFGEFISHAYCTRSLLYLRQTSSIIKRALQSCLGVEVYEKLRKSCLEKTIK